MAAISTFIEKNDMAKYGRDITNKICHLIRSDSYTIAEVCKSVGIALSTYYEWMETKSEFSDAVKKAQGDFDQMIASEAKKSLVKLVKGYDVEEVKMVTVGGKLKEKTTTTKHYQPNTAAVIFALTNRDPEKWSNRQSIEATGKNGEPLFDRPRVLSKKEAKEYLKELDNEY